VSVINAKREVVPRSRKTSQCAPGHHSSNSTAMLQCALNLARRPRELQVDKRLQPNITSSACRGNEGNCLTLSYEQGVPCMQMQQHASYDHAWIVICIAVVEFAWCHEHKLQSSCRQRPINLDHLPGKNLSQVCSKV